VEPEQEKEEQSMHVERIMTPNPVAVAPHDSLRWAIHLMKKGSFRRLPVIEEGQLVGIVTVRDIRLATDLPVILGDYPLHDRLREKWCDEWPLDNITVGACMARDPITVTPDTNVGEAARLMRDRKIGGLPVVQGGQLVGIVTKMDVLNCFIELLEIGAALEPRGRRRHPTVARWPSFSGQKRRQILPQLS
jgi:acetoin utilization protein AcuB